VKCLSYIDEARYLKVNLLPDGRAGILSNILILLQTYYFQSVLNSPQSLW